MLTFTVYGQPVPYKRTTQNSKWTDANYKRYQCYKDAIVLAFLEQCEGNWNHIKPLTTVRGQKTKVELMIYFKNFAHGDSDNVMKGLLDALFECDKYVSGSFDFDYDRINPRIEVKIS